MSTEVLNLLFLAVMGSVMLWLFIQYYAKKRAKATLLEDKKTISADYFENICNGTTFFPKHGLCNASDGLYLAISEEPPAVLISIRDANYNFSDWNLDVEGILSVAFTIDDKAVYQAGPVVTIAAAAAGGAVLGGAAAIVGALSAGRIGSGKISRATLDLRMNDLNRASVSIPFINANVKLSDKPVQERLKLAEQWLNIIEVMRHRTNRKQLGDSQLKAKVYSAQISTIQRVDKKKADLSPKRIGRMLTIGVVAMIVLVILGHFAGRHNAYQIEQNIKAISYAIDSGDLDGALKLLALVHMSDKERDSRFNELTVKVKSKQIEKDCIENSVNKFESLSAANDDAGIAGLTAKCGRFSPDLIAKVKLRENVAQQPVIESKRAFMTTIFKPGDVITYDELKAIVESKLPGTIEVSHSEYWIPIGNEYYRLGIIYQNAGPKTDGKVQLLEKYSQLPDTVTKAQIELSKADITRAENAMRVSAASQMASIKPCEARYKEARQSEKCAQALKVKLVTTDRAGLVESYYPDFDHKYIRNACEPESQNLVGCTDGDAYYEVHISDPLSGRRMGGPYSELVSPTGRVCRSIAKNGGHGNWMVCERLK